MSEKDSPLNIVGNLGEPIPINPEKLLTQGAKDPFEEFFLALALIYNDLKTALMLGVTIDKAAEGKEISAREGQRSGTVIYLLRMMIGILHELLKLISENESIIKGALFIKILDHIPPKHKIMWERLVTHATDGSKTSKLLKMIRNTTAFHYYQPRMLANGYSEFFFKDAKKPNNKNAFVSLGKTMDAMRFYYADAAAERSIELLGSRNEIADIPNEVDKLIDDTNFSIASLLRAYIFSRDPDSKVTPMPGSLL
jgi:hypothetical protein